MQHCFELLFLYSVSIFATSDANEAKIEWTVNFDDRNLTILDDENFVKDIVIADAVNGSVKEGTQRNKKPDIFEEIKKQSGGCCEAYLNELIKDIEGLYIANQASCSVTMEVEDLEERNDKLSAKIKKQEADIHANGLAISVLQVKLKVKPTRPTIAPEPAKTCDGLIFQGRCYFGIFYISGSMSYAEGEEICAEKGAVVGHFRRVDHYNMMMRLLRNELERVTPYDGLSTITNSYLWLGMKIHWETQKVSTVADGPVFQLWKKNYPTPRGTYTAVFFEVHFNKYGTPKEGMQNTSPHLKAKGVLCEKPY